MQWLFALQFSAFFVCANTHNLLDRSCAVSHCAKTTVALLHVFLYVRIHVQFCVESCEQLLCVMCLKCIAPSRISTHNGFLPP